MLVRRTLGVVLLATACTATGNDSGPTAGAQGKAEVPAKADASKPADVPVGGKAEVRMPVGATFSETLTTPRNPVDHASWSPEPKIEGTAVRFVERLVELPPADVDGGSHSFTYRFEAVAPGKAEVSFTRSSPESKAPIDEVRVTVVVTED